MMNKDTKLRKLQQELEDSQTTVSNLQAKVLELMRENNTLRDYIANTEFVRRLNNSHLTKTIKDFDMEDSVRTKYLHHLETQRILKKHYTNEN